VRCCPMSDRVAANALAHPAARAWGVLEPGRNRAGAIEVLKDALETKVYRLYGVGPGGSAVIAKRRRIQPGQPLIERTAFEHVFPRLPVPTLRFFGFVEDEDPRFGWLFLEDAGTLRYSPWSEEHRALAGRWIGVLHKHGPGADPGQLLPSRDSTMYLEGLRTACRSIMSSVDNDILDDGDRSVLWGTVALLRQVESRWSELAEPGGHLTRTLALGNFVPRNCLVREGQGGLTLLVVDCESLGWGNPIRDLAQSYDRMYGTGFSANPDIGSYFQETRDHRPGLDLSTLQQLAAYGTVLRCVTTIGWEAPSLATDWAANIMPRMRAYHAILPHAMRIAGWRS
jgi:hypothetical protein